MTTTDKASSRDQFAPARDYLGRDAAIVEALRTAGRPLSLQEVGDAIGETKDRGELCRPILKRLVAAGIIAESGIRPRLFALALSASASDARLHQPIAWRYREADWSPWLYSEEAPADRAGWPVVEPLYAQPNPDLVGSRQQVVAIECCGVCRYVRPAAISPNRLVCRRHAPRSEWGVVDKKLSVPLVNADDWCGEFDGRPAPIPVSHAEQVAA